MSSILQMEKLDQPILDLFADFTSKINPSLVEIGRTQVNCTDFNTTVFKLNPSVDDFINCVERSRRAAVSFSGVYGINYEVAKEFVPELKLDTESHIRTKRAMVTEKNVLMFDLDLKDCFFNFREQIPKELCEKLDQIPESLESEELMELRNAIYCQMPVSARKELAQWLFQQYQDRFKTIGFHPWTVVYSGNGLHFYFFLSKPIDTTDHKLYGKFYSLLCNILKEKIFDGKVMIDQSFCNPAQPLRILMTRNWKRGNDPLNKKNLAAIDPELLLHDPSADSWEYFHTIHQSCCKDMEKTTPIVEGVNPKLQEGNDRFQVVEDYKERLRSALTFKEMLEFAGYTKMETLQDTGSGETRLSSPWSVDNNPSCYFNEKKGVFKCFSTKNEGDKFKFLALLLKLDCEKDFSEILKVASKITGIQPIIFTSLSKSTETEFTRVGNFIVKKDGLYELVKRKLGEIELEFANRLSNFIPKIICKETHTDGLISNRLIKINGILENGKSLPEIVIPSREFASMDWVFNCWSSDPQMFVVDRVKEKVRLAMQMISGEVPETTVYGHTGWRKFGDEWKFLHTGGAIGKDGNQRDIIVDLGTDKLNCYRLTDSLSGDELKSAIKDSLSIINIDAKGIGMALLGSAYLAPLGEMLDIDFSEAVVGKTGGLKSTTTAVVQAHFGSGFHVKNLPGNWSSTANSLEKMSFTLKDVMFTIDEFKPQGTEREQQQWYSKADRVLRSSANGQGRGRLDKNLSHRNEYYSRSLIASTGEVPFKNHSLRARLWEIEVGPSDLQDPIIQPLIVKAREGVFVKAMSSYIQWLAPQVDQLKSQLTDLKETKRDEYKKICPIGTHRRTPEIVSQIMIGYELFCRFAVESEALSENEAATLLDQVKNKLLSSIEIQVSEQDENDPAKLFLPLLSAILISGKGHLADWKTGRPPANPTHYGWRSRGSMLPVSIDPAPSDADKNEDEARENQFQPCGDKLGWVGENGELYLEETAAYTAVKNFARLQGSPMSEDQRTLFKRMREQGLLIVNEKSRNTIKKRIEGKSKWVVWVRKNNDE